LRSDADRSQIEAVAPRRPARVSIDRPRTPSREGDTYVLIRHYDINGFAKKAPAALVAEVEDVLKKMNLHVKLSNEKGKKDRLVFNPKGTNAHMKVHLAKKGWKNDIPIPADLSAFGIHVDHGKGGLLVETQFSNYPFFPNNVVRAHLFHARGTNFATMGKVEAALIVTKCKMFDASQSTLYYEQAVEQLKIMDALGLVKVPMRIVGVCVDRGVAVSAVESTYKEKNWDRKAIKHQTIKVRVGEPDHERGRERIVRV
jgi:hypothetical protein